VASSIGRQAAAYGRQALAAFGSGVIQLTGSVIENPHGLHFQVLGEGTPNPDFSNN